MPFLGNKKQVDKLNTTMQKNRWAQKIQWSEEKSLLDNKSVTVLKKFLSKCFEVPPGTQLE